MDGVYFMDVGAGARSSRFFGTTSLSSAFQKRWLTVAVAARFNPGKSTISLTIGTNADLLSQQKQPRQRRISRLTAVVWLLIAGLIRLSADVVNR
jgi:hypothetical protein